MSLARLRRSEGVQRVAVGVAAATSKGGPTLMGTAMAVYVSRAGGTPMAVSLVLAVYFGGLMVCSPVWGALGDVTGRRRDVLVVAGALSTLAVLPLTVVSGVWLPLGVRALFAAFAAGYLPALLTIVSARGGAAARGRSVGLFSSAQAVGFTVGQVLAGVLLGALAPGALYLFVAGVGAVVVLAALVIEDPTPGDAAAERLPPRALLQEVRRRLLPTADRDHLHANGLRWLFIAVWLRNMTVIGTSSLLPVFLVADLGVDEALMGLLLAINPAGQMAFMYVGGRAADRIGRKPLIVGGMVGSGAYALCMAGSGFLAGPARLGLVALGMVVLAAAFSGLRVGSVSFIGDVAPPNRESELIGLRSTARGFGGVLGPVVLGGVATVAGFETAFAAGSLLAFAGSLLCARGLVESLPGRAAPA